MVARVPASVTAVRRVLVVGGGFFQLELVHAARRLGLEVAVVDRSAGAPGMVLADHPLTIDTADVERVVAAARALGISAVATAASDAAVPAVAAVAAALGLPGISPDTARLCRDKLATATHLAGAGLPAPPTTRVTSLAEAREAAAALGAFPVVVKPRSGAGGRGVTVVHDPGGLAPALERALGHARPGEGALVQGFVGGQSVGAEVVYAGGRVAHAFLLGDQFQDGFASPVGHSLPAEVAEGAAIVEDLERIGAALGLGDGAANFDLRRAAGRTVLLEVNARPGGSSIGELVRLAHGVELAEVTLLGALGEPVEPLLRPRRDQPAACRLLLARGRGRLVVDGDPRAPWRDHPGVATLELTAEPGAPVTSVVDDWSIFGRCLTTGETAAAAVALAERVARDVAARVSLEAA